jgi:mannose-1-phosphate guanylyltransferase
MAGGSGERFWPLSRQRRPKQMLRLTSPSETLLEEAINRVEPLVGKGHVYVATGRSLEEPVREASVVPEANHLVEPSKRNTLGCLCWLASNMIARHPGDWRNLTVAVLTADHKIGDAEHFRQCVDAALHAAEETGGLVTIGIKPSRAETGYGYIELDATHKLQNAPIETHKALSFREKPSREVAEGFVSAGTFLWNSGMFFWTLGSFMGELTKARSEAATLVTQMAEALAGERHDIAAKLFDELPNLSIDYALMEKSENVFVVSASFVWDDVGAWDALERALPTDDAENVIQGHVVAMDTTGSIVYNENPDMIACVVGVQDLVVVTTADAVLVCPKSRAQEVRRIVEELKARGSHAL